MLSDCIHPTRFLFTVNRKSVTITVFSTEVKIMTTNRKNYELNLRATQKFTDRSTENKIKDMYSLH